LAEGMSAPGFDVVERRLRSTNPFSTRWVRPGALPYLWPHGAACRELMGRLHAGATLEIIGPHGSGKSTLVATLIELLRAQGRAVQLETLHDGGRRRWRQRQDGSGPCVRIVDGFEQLSGWRRRLTRWRSARAGEALVVTGHAPLGMDHRISSELDAARAVQVVEALLRRAELSTAIDPRSVIARVERHRGNLREALFELYDVYETERIAHRQAAAAAAQPPGGLSGSSTRCALAVGGLTTMRVTAGL
jgi:ATP/maltotriose-dependent transcriptional regulator MalT